MKNGITFLTGIGRSGTSIFYKVLSHHPEVYWLSPFADRYLDKPQRNDWLINNIDTWLPSWFRKRFVPVECYRFFNQSFRGFGRPFRDLVAEDVSDRTKKLMRASFERFDVSKTPHLTTKITGWPRIGFLNEVFPEAKFVHINRDGKAIVNSYLNVHFWLGWQGPEKWRWGVLSDEHQELWEKHNKSFVALAAIQYMIYSDAFEAAKSKMESGKVLEIRYEDFVKDPKAQLKMAIDFMGLTWSPTFEKALARFKITDANVKWKRDLSDLQQKELSQIIDPYQEQYGG